MERSVALNDAERTIDEFFRKNNMAVKIEKHGSLLSSTVATIEFLKMNEESCIGCGKGYEEEARVVAKYEAYEHFQGLISLRRHCTLIPFNDIISQPDVNDFLPLKILSDSNPTQISAVIFNPTHNNTNSLLWPSFMIDYKYASNQSDGDDADYRAARFGFTEAAIHAVSEVIERHCVGVYLARTFFYGFDAELLDRLARNRCLICCVKRSTMQKMRWAMEYRLLI